MDGRIAVGRQPLLNHLRDALSRGYHDVLVNHGPQTHRLGRHNQMDLHALLLRVEIDSQGLFRRVLVGIYGADIERILPLGQIEVKNIFRGPVGDAVKIQVFPVQIHLEIRAVLIQPVPGAVLDLDAALFRIRAHRLAVGQVDFNSNFIGTASSRGRLPLESNFPLIPLPLPVGIQADHLKDRGLAGI